MFFHKNSTNNLIFEYRIREKCKVFGITDLSSFYKQWFTAFPNGFLQNFNPSFKEINDKFNSIKNNCMNAINSFSVGGNNPIFNDINADVAEILCTGRTKKKKISFITDRNNLFNDPPKKEFSICIPIPPKPPLNPNLNQKLVCEASSIPDFGRIKSTGNTFNKKNKKESGKFNPKVSDSKISLSHKNKIKNKKKLKTSSNVNYSANKLKNPFSNRTQISFINPK